MISNTHIFKYKNTQPFKEQTVCYTWGGKRGKGRTKLLKRWINTNNIDLCTLLHMRQVLRRWQIVLTGCGESYLKKKTVSLK